VTKTLTKTYYIVEDTDGATYITLRSIIEDHEHTLLHATTPQTAALINTLRHQFAEHIRTTLYNIRTYALHQQAVLHSAHPPVNNFPLPPSPFILHPNNGLPYDTPVIPTATAYPVHSPDISQLHISSPLPPGSIPHHPLHHKVDSASTPYVAGAKPESLRRGLSAAYTSTAPAVNTEDSSHLKQRKHT